MRCECGQKNPPEARFCMACGRALGALLPEERRYVSVLFYDLVDSSQHFQAGLQVAYQQLQEALEEAARVARAKGGFVHRFLGDGILVLFGAPRARGKEPWRALEAALEMVGSSPLPARAGVASGEVLWAPLGSGQAGEPTAVGPPVVLAERLSKLAHPGEVLTEPTTLALAPGVAADPLGPREAKGLGAVEVFRVRSVSLDLGPEGEALLDTLLKAFQGPPARLNLVGPPGSGKSLLLYRFLELTPHPVVVLERMGPETPLRTTLRQAVEHAFGQVEAFLALAELSPELSVALRYSLGLEARPPWKREALEAAIYEAWKRVLENLPHPLLLVAKNLHTPDGILQSLLQHSFPHLMVLAESRKPLFQPTLEVQGLKAPPLLALQPALDALPLAERQALLALGVLHEALVTLPLEQSRTELLRIAERLMGTFSTRRLEKEGLLQEGKPLPEILQVARALVPEEQAKAWHREAALFYREKGAIWRMAQHLKRAGQVQEAVQALRLLAQEAWRQGHPERAIPLYREALEAAPSSWRASLQKELQDAQASLGQAPEAQGGPRSQDPVLASFRQAQNPLDLLPLLPGLKPYPLEEAQARLQVAGALWRAFQPQQALEVLKPPHPLVPSPLRLHWQSLKAGLLMDLGRYAEAEALLKEKPPGDLESETRFQATRLRLLLETGRLPEALEEGEAAHRQMPHPWLAAALLSAWTLRGRFREDLFQTALLHPDGKALGVLALAHYRVSQEQDPTPLLKEALREARRLSNPYVYHLALTSLALYLWPRSPNKAKTLSQYLLYQTHRTGFAVHLEVARLLRAQLLLEQGEKVEHLLGFPPSVPLTRVWQAVLAGEEPDGDLRGYGILGRWVLRLWRKRGVGWTRHKR
ncbi:adenylate/guanylate cyclase domain-containing protein [Thermus scotoductus]|uniref:Adenylate/guanylate cyclase domain-containing protein n=1 Tax=Thermus scotoductus TaxID=37636 RepID=A0A430S9J6_THESC|nr:tetratricopeptide repeat protein [Thermus scotoductus]RTG96355.1 adenylate/guanylate cyclase domain-containing protein [Thermus scotoductus]RTH06612.1 adenylate/guanylate cyclase domain-containing protein [Thermus scotoductus]RTH10325.1 adenylate/guanylate cyclase domain-containing protein [Thermus scotoductus]RTH12029.1 adenylate/guanylate cyclase domain-containing protein [Thermus scotoductus]RTH16560.1 adenylate/guanylate cyclase domain-containing protein [Thermus scotoductus]